MHTYVHKIKYMHMHLGTRNTHRLTASIRTVFPKVNKSVSNKIYTECLKISLFTAALIKHRPNYLPLTDG